MGDILFIPIHKYIQIVMTTKYVQPFLYLNRVNMTLEQSYN